MERRSVLSSPPSAAAPLPFGRWFRVELYYRRLALLFWVLALLLALALLDVGQGWPLLPRWLLWLGSVAAPIFALYWGWRQHPTPPRHAQLARIEQASHLPHQPLQALEHDPAKGSDADLWAEFKRRSAANLGQLRRPDFYNPLLQQDKLAVRAMVAMLLAIGLSQRGDVAFSQIADFYAAPPLPLPSLPPLLASGQLTPPDFTGQAAFPLPAANEPIAAVIGTELQLSIAHSWWAPSLLVNDTSIPMQPRGNGYTANVTLQQGDKIAVRYLLRQRMVWPLQLQPNNPPQITLVEPPSSTKRASIKFKIKASDDFGLAEIGVALQPPYGSKQNIILSQSQDAPRSLQRDFFLDLASSDFAGEKVELQLYARDNTGLLAASDPIHFTLPVREFTHPVARELIRLRTELRYAKRYPSDIASDIYRLSSEPAEFAHDQLVYLGMVVAAQRLALYHNQPDARPEVPRLLFQLAARIEDGGVTEAEQELRQALQELQEKLANENASSEELNQAAAKFAAALEQYLQALEKFANSRTNAGESGAEAQANAEILRNIMKQLQEQQEIGGREGIQKFLENLQQNMENTDLEKMAEQSAEMQRQLNEIAAIIRAEEKLLADNKAAKTKPDTAEIERQQQLRQRLADIIAAMAETLPQVPDGFAKADQAMRQAIKALQDNNRPAAATQQQAAIDALKEGAGQTMQQIMSMSPMAGMMPQRRDPLGRAMPGNHDDNVRLPSQSQRRAVQQWIEEIRRRVGDWSQPTEEREYFQRLLEPF